MGGCTGGKGEERSEKGRKLSFSPLPSRLKPQIASLLALKRGPISTRVRCTFKLNQEFNLLSHDFSQRASRDQKSVRGIRIVSWSFLAASMSVVKPTSFSSKTTYRAAVLYGLNSEI